MVEIRIRERGNGVISQKLYEVPDETGIEIMNICECAVRHDATPIEFGCKDGVCEIPADEPSDTDKLVGRLLP